MRKLLFLISFLHIIKIEVMAQDKNFFTIPSIPEKLRWIDQPVQYLVDDTMLKMRTGPLTDMFINPMGTRTTLNAPKSVFGISGDFQLSARVRVGFASDFDAGVLIVYQDQENWAKLCFEYSPQHQPMIVSVVTRGSSDDANSAIIEDDQVYLRISGLGNVFVFHYSKDGQYWHFVRYFKLDSGQKTKVGFSVQSPTGHGCEAEFKEISFRQKKLVNLRDGS
jgi:uncharacterized protein